MPFLPFANEEENRSFAECVLRNDFPIDDEEKAAVAWCKFVDGVKIFPKLPVHIRIHKEAFERNQRVKSCVDNAREGTEILDELNSVLKPDTPAFADPIPEPEPLPVIHANATHNLQYVTTGGTAVGNVPKPSRKRKVGERGKDRPGKTRRPRRCCRCLRFNGEYASECTGRKTAREKCDYFDAGGVRRCGRCATFGEGAHAYECTATRGRVNNCEYFDENGETIER